MEQDFYSNFFTIRDEDRKKTLIYLDSFLGLNNSSFNASIDASKAPNTYVVRKGSKWADVLFASSLNLVVSEQFKELFQNFKGVSFFPVNILSKDLIVLEVNYFNMVITGKCGGIVNELSKEVLATRIVGGPVFIKRLGLYFDLTTWDRSDFFNPEKTLNIFITQKVKDLIEKHKLTNVRITSISEVENFII